MAARYLLNCKDAHRTKWAAAGRNEAKIAEVLRELGAKNVPIIVADSHDEWAVTDMMKKTRCIISTVGPYARYGTTLVEVASREGVSTLYKGCVIGSLTYTISNRSTMPTSLARRTGTTTCRTSSTAWQKSRNLSFFTAPASTLCLQSTPHHPPRAL